MGKPSGLPVLPEYPSGNSYRMQGLRPAGLQNRLPRIHPFQVDASARRSGLRWSAKRGCPFWKRTSHFARFACIHAGSENPVVRYNATLSLPKSTPKPTFPQVFGEIVVICPIFTRFCPVLANFAPRVEPFSLALNSRPSRRDGSRIAPDVVRNGPRNPGKSIGKDASPRRADVKTNVDSLPDSPW
jgi:hypothetical protein